MIVLSHRGYWKKDSEKNKAIAFERSFSLGFGTETDIREYKGELVISHDIADEACMSVEQFFELYNGYDLELPLALNIKSDGLQQPLSHLLSKYNIVNYFVFDMSVPDGLQYLAHKINSYTRQSEYENPPSFYQNSQGVWLDEFNGHWISKSIIKQHLKYGKKVCIVSPDLHKRAYEPEWQDYKSMEQNNDINELMICTDHPEKARLFFNA